MPAHVHLPELPLQRNPLLIVLAIVLAMVAFGGGLVALVERWINQEEYSHGFFIPLIALWFAWNRRQALVASLGRANWLGFAVMLASLGLLFLGEVTALFTVIQLGFLLCLAGLVLAFGGWSLLRLCVLPIGLLLFAIPLPYFVDAQLSWRLQLISSFLGVEFLRAVGYSVFLDGNVIDLGTYKLQVVEACSGLRYLYPLLSIGFLVAYLYRAALVWRAVLFLSTIPITVLMNSLRIAIVGMLVERWGSSMADGFLHYFEGWVVFLACLLILLGEVWLIERFTRRRPMRDAISLPEVAPAVPARPRGQGLPRPALVAVGCLVLSILAVNLLAHRTENIPARTTLASFPLTLDSWRATESSMPSEIERFLGVSDYLLADYVDPSRNAVNLYVAYYASQRKGVSPHSPEVCIPGGGWAITGLGTVPLEGSPGSSAVRVLIAKGDQHMLVYYWFEERGRRIANQYAMKWYLFEDALLYNRTDGALVRLVTGVPPNEDIATADRRLQSFASLMLPKLGRYVPN